MNHQEFNEQFGTEVQCRYNWRAMREKNGVSCQRCGSKVLVWKEKRWEWRCMGCQTTLTLRSGTMMEHSNLPFAVWYRILYLMTCTKKGLSALEMQRQVGWKRYQPVWYAMQKIRIVMGNRDQRYQLEGTVEVDDAFITAIRRHPKRGRKRKRGSGKRGRGTETKSAVLVMTSAQKIDNPGKGRPNFYSKYVKMYQVEKLNSDTIEGKMKVEVTTDSTIKSDAFSGYSKLKFMFKKHHAKVTPPEKAHKMLPCVHTMIGNVKRFIDGILHHVDDDYLQNYLNEFCYKMNRRYLPNIFERVVIAGVDHDWGDNG